MSSSDLLVVEVWASCMDWLVEEVMWWAKVRSYVLVEQLAMNVFEPWVVRMDCLELQLVDVDDL